MKRFICMFLSFCVICSLCCCIGPKGKNSDVVYKGVERLNATAQTNFSTNSLKNDDYKKAYDEFAFEFFSAVEAADKDSNVCLSPFSAYMAFSLCFAGSAGTTAEEFKEVFGLSKEDASEFCRSLYANFLQREYSDKNTKFNLANSVWMDNAYAPYVKDSYLQVATNYFDAPIFRCDFSDSATVNAVNKWCNDNTDGLIDKIIDKFDEDQIMALINALLIEAAWVTPYNDSEVVIDSFKNKDLTTSQTKFLSKKISSYYSADDAVAFKTYLWDGFSFVGILPNEEISIDDYCENLTFEKINALLENGKNPYDVYTRIPKFNTDYEVDLVEIMQSMGLNFAFNKYFADFKPMIELPTSNVYIGSAIQKTHFELDENGIKAAAVTYIGMSESTSLPIPKPKMQIYLDRPFVYLMMDEATGLPMFVGTVKNIHN